VIFYAPAPAFTGLWAEIQRCVFWRIPAFFLVCRLNPLGKTFFSIGEPGLRRTVYRTVNRNAACFAIAFPGLIIIGVLAALAARFFGILPDTMPPAPEGAAAWAVTALTALTVGYLEEGYFRAYLLPRLEGAGIRAAEAVIAGTALFALCHAWEGPGGIINAALAGLFLSLLWMKFKSLHGLALAHALYNVAAYAVIAWF